ncbi:ankycorbin [Malaya genurostris]|uniref:ankycorbin n=1 Tax=Malaya genurostris TaxID=325434 RepID=UPI0026F39AD7|nr:ankycorbin [Malaya genurostris]XP_058447051.1 ankycorbin [Malaya genurostris]XP_058447052.1 ankycorbin [Malaya genurostris]XP_058447053.1 ankycorbin [Malaya genurostris]XP_058447055.1 ankycorbin [Malaya genurostris]XP_058447056.1 ankycorbin [Malaya genurostris]
MSYNYSPRGRTGSQTSINDYPEHLNPFYEDDNHKRLRFWQLGSHRYSKPKSERRGSLVSIRDGLRDMWEFKTFRLKKKRSSTLGINKTSESPPPLRRDDHDSQYHTLCNSSAYRSTIGTVGYSQSTSNTPLFERNTRYRSSLQDQSTGNGIGFRRNDRYRSTVQNGYATYGGASMITSTPRSRYSNNTNERGMRSGISQSSLKSTNPFDEDDDVGSISESNNGTLRTRQRKKRRAPPPPVRRFDNTSVQPTDAETLEVRLKIEESPPPDNSDDISKLTSLTAEIESFVRTTSNNDEDKVTIEKTQPLSDSNNNNVNELKIIETEENRTQLNETKQITNAQVDQLRPVQLKTEPAGELSRKPIESEPIIPEPVEQISYTEELKINDEQRQITPPLPSPRAKSSPPPIPQSPPMSEEIDIENVALPDTPIPARRLNKNRNQSNVNGKVLQITESSDSTGTTTTEEEENMESKTFKHVNYEFEYKVKPIKTEIDEKIGTARTKISESVGAANAAPSVCTERRRSVRDIIESINKSQSLLKVNHESSGTLYSAQSNDSVNRNLKELNERERELQLLITEMDTRFRGRSSEPPTRKRGSFYDNVPENGDENADNLLSNSDMRAKKSPTKSLGMDQTDEIQFKDCIDWNPLPKPRRSRHFSDQPSGNGLTDFNQNNSLYKKS